MNCAECKNLLVSYIEQLLDDSQKRMVGEHLSRCPSCREELEGLQTLHGRLMQNGKAVGQTSVEDDVMKRIMREQNTKLKEAENGPGRQISTSLVTRLAIAAALIGGIAGVLVTLGAGAAYGRFVASTVGTTPFLAAMIGGSVGLAGLWNWFAELISSYQGRCSRRHEQATKSLGQFWKMTGRDGHDGPARLAWAGRSHLARSHRNEEEVAIETVQAFLETAKWWNSDQAGPFLEQVPQDLFREWFSGMKVIGPRSIGKPKAYPNPGIAGFVVPCEVELEAPDGTRLTRGYPALCVWR